MYQHKFALRVEKMKLLNVCDLPAVLTVLSHNCTVVTKGTDEISTTSAMPQSVRTSSRLRKI